MKPTIREIVRLHLDLAGYKPRPFDLLTQNDKPGQKAKRQRKKGRKK